MLPRRRHKISFFGDALAKLSAWTAVRLWSGLSHQEEDFLRGGQHPSQQAEGMASEGQDGGASAGLKIVSALFDLMGLSSADRVLPHLADAADLHLQVPVLVHSQVPVLETSEGEKPMERC